MHHTTRRKAIVRIGKELRNRGWELYGFTEDNSDPMTDYYSPAHWDGVATHPELGNTVVCVDVDEYTVKNYSGNGHGWPEFQATPYRKTWHVERDGEILKAGVGLAPCAQSPDWEKKVERIVDQMERVAYRATPKKASSGSSLILDNDTTVTIEHDRDWTWLYFSHKPPSEVRGKLKAMGAHWSHKRSGWYFRRDVPDEELEWLVGKSNRFIDRMEQLSEEAKAQSEERVPLVLNDEGMDADPTGYEPGKGDTYDYIPAWMRVPGLGKTEGRDNPLAVVKVFTPDSDFTWFVVEYDPDDEVAFGLVARGDPALTELGYFSIDELADVNGPMGLKPERDKWFRPKPITELAAYQEKWGANGPYPGPQREDLDRQREETTDRLIFPDGWTRQDVEALLEALDDGPILISTSGLGIPTIHDFSDPRHLGFGMFEVKTPDYTVQYDAGGAMVRTPSGKAAWTRLRITEGEYDYPFEKTRAILEALSEMSTVDDDEANEQPQPVFDVGDKVRLTGDDEVHTVKERDYTGEDVGWVYLVDGQHWMESKLVHVLSDEENDQGQLVEPLPRVEVQPVSTENAGTKPRTVYRARPEGTDEWAWHAWDEEAIQEAVRASLGDCDVIWLPDGESTEGSDVDGVTHLDIQLVVEPDGREHFRARITDTDEWQWTGWESDNKLVHHLIDQLGGVVTHYAPFLHRLQYGDNGEQVYFEGSVYSLLNPYLKRDGQRYATGWVWHYRDESTNDEWWCLEDSDSSCIGAQDLSEAVACAERLTSQSFELIGKPDDLPESYPLPPWFSSESAEETDVTAEEFTAGVIAAFYEEGDQVWWMEDGDVRTGVVDYTSATDGEVVVTCDDRLAIVVDDGSIPIGRIEHLPAGDLNVGLVPEKHLAQVSGLRTGETVWWHNPNGDVVIAEVKEICYFDSWPTITLRRRVGVVSDDGESVSVEGQVGFTLKEFKSKDPQKGMPEDVTVIEPGDTVVAARDITVAGCNVFSPKGNRCRSDRKVNAGDQFELVEFSKSQGAATHGSVYAAVRNGDGYELHIPVPKLALTGVEEIGAEPEKEVEPDAESDDGDTETIEVDLGRAHGWVVATIRKRRGDWIYYELEEDKPDKHGGKLKAYARDILWRPAATAM